MEDYSIVHGSEPGLEGAKMPLGFGEIFLVLLGVGGEGQFCVCQILSCRDGMLIL